MNQIKPVAAVIALSLGLSACYVVPIDSQYPNRYPVGAFPSGTTAIVPMAAVRSPYTVRLYPANDNAARQGGASGLISNPEQGHGQFTMAIGGETFTGEATRGAGSNAGVANATGSRGGYVRCNYTMSNHELGSGTCNFSNGARYDMHVSQ